MSKMEWKFCAERVVNRTFLLLAMGAAAAGLIEAQQPALTWAAGRAVIPVAQSEPAPGLASGLAPEAPQANTPPMKDDLFAGTEKFAKGASEVTEVNMDPDSLDMVSGSDAKRAHRMVLNVVRTYAYDKPGMYNMADVDEFRRKLETGDWHCSVHTRDLKSGESTDVCSKRRSPDMIENAIITVGPKELTFIHTIRKANGGESRVDWSVLPGLSAGLPLNVTLAIEPQVQAQIVAASAALSANAGEMTKAMEGLRAELPRLNGQELQEQMKKMQEQMKQWQQSAPTPEAP